MEIMVAATLDNINDGRRRNERSERRWLVECYESSSRSYQSSMSGSNRIDGSSGKTKNVNTATKKTMKNWKRYLGKTYDKVCSGKIRAIPTNTFTRWKLRGCKSRIYCCARTWSRCWEKRFNQQILPRCWKEAMRRSILDEGKRLMVVKPPRFAPFGLEVDYLPGAHGSGNIHPWRNSVAQRLH